MPYDPARPGGARHLKETQIEKWPPEVDTEDVMCATQILVALDQTTQVAVAWTVAAAVTIAVTLLTPSNPSVQVGNGFTSELTALLLMIKAGLAT